MRAPQLKKTNSLPGTSFTHENSQHVDCPPPPTQSLTRLLKLLDPPQRFARFLLPRIQQRAQGSMKDSAVSIAREHGHLLDITDVDANV